MTHEELEKDRRAFMEGRMTAASYWNSFFNYWSQFNKEKGDEKGGEQ